MIPTCHDVISQTVEVQPQLLHLCFHGPEGNPRRREPVAGCEDIEFRGLSFTEGRERCEAGQDRADGPPVF